MPGTSGITLVVLAGGGGTRLGGVHKPLLPLEGRPLLAHVLERLAPSTDAPPIVVTRTPHLYMEALKALPAPLPYGARVVTDRLSDGGPLAGLEAALAGCETEWVLLVGGDMPRVHPEAVRLLGRACREPPEIFWACFVREGRREPLPGLYRRGAMEVLPALLAEGAGLQALMRATAGVEVDVEALRTHDAALESLRGINTPEDAARLGIVLPRPEP